MLNLINNAIKYTKEGSVSIDVSFDREESRLRFVVADTGIGIKNEDLGKLFNAFQRLEEDKNRNIEGTGLGLNITMRLVKMMDGSISVSSKYGEGTTFTAEMVQEVEDDTPVGDFVLNLERAQEAKEEYRPALVAPGAKILIVDDNAMNLEVISNLLSDTRIQITTALSGAECLTCLSEDKYDVVLLDQMMPVMTGTQTLEEIRKRHLADDTPVIALTADAIVGARDIYIEEGFTDYLSKPIMYRDLEEALIKYIDKSLLKETEEAAKEHPVVLVVSESTEKLNEIKVLLGDKYKGVFVKDEEKAQKYLSKHEVKYIIHETSDGENRS